MKTGMRKSLLAISLLAIYGNAYSEAKGLLQVYQLGLQQDARLGAAAAQMRSEQEAYDTNLAGLLPSAGAQGKYEYTDTEYKTTTTTNKNAYTYSYGAQVTQPIYRKDKIESFLQGRVLERQAKERYDAASQDFILRITQAYLDVLQAKDNLELTRVEKSANDGLRQRAKRSFEVGSATVNDVNEAQARYDLAVAREIAAVSNLEIARQNMTKITGEYTPDLFGLRTELALELPQPNDVEHWIKKADENPQVKIAADAKDVAAYEVERLKGLIYPALDLVGSYGHSKQLTPFGSSDLESTNASVAVQLTVPLYGGGLPQSRLRAARADQDRAAKLYEDTRRQAIVQVRTAFLSLTNGIEQVRALQQAVVSSQGAVDSTQRGLEVGLRTSLDVLNAQQQLFSAKRDLANARYQYLMNQLKLKAAIGSLAEADVQSLDKWFAK